MSLINSNGSGARQVGIWFAKLKTKGGKPQAKTITRKGGGLYKTGESIPLTSGTVEAVELSDIDAFIDVVESGEDGPDTAFTYGLPPQRTGIIATKKAIASGRAPKGAISRSADCFNYYEGAPAILMLDGDPSEMTAGWSPLDHDAELCSILPESYEAARRGVGPSGGAGIYDSLTRARLDGSSGFRIYLAVDDGGRIKAIGNGIVATLIRAGFGHVAFAKNGRRMLRTFIDAAVWQAERLDFANGSNLVDEDGGGIYQERPFERLGDVPLLISNDMPQVADLSAWMKTDPDCIALMEAALPRSKEIRAEWLASRVASGVAALVALGWTPEKALISMRAMVARSESVGAHDVMTEHELLYLNDDSVVTVREVLDNPKYYHGMSLRDPFEPEAGPTKAMLFLLGQKHFPIINCQLHGGYWVRLVDIEKEARAGLGDWSPSELPSLAFPFADAVPVPQAAPAPRPAPPRGHGLPPAPTQEPQASAVVLPFKSVHLPPPPPAPPGAAAPVPYQGTAATAVALDAGFHLSVYVEPVVSLDPGRDLDELLGEMPNNIKTQLDRADVKGSLKFVIQQLLRRKLTPGEVYTLLEPSKVGEAALFDGNLKVVVKEGAIEFDRRAKQKKDDIEVGNERSMPVEPVVTLKEMVKNFVWIVDGSYVYDRETGRLLSFADAMGCYIYSTTIVKTGKIVKDMEETKEFPTLDLWRKHPERSTVDVPTWAPGKGPITAAPDGIGTAVNTWKGFRPYAPPPDWERLVGLWDAHIEYLIPIASERKRFLQWLAHILQNPGELPHTYYMLIAVMTGIGRSWLGSVLSRVFRGYVANGVDLNQVLAGNFNGQLSKKMLIIVEEAHEGLDGKDRRERAQKLKSIITEADRRIRPKYGREYTEQNAARWLMFSNHPDPLPIEDNDRRAEFIENPTEAKSKEYYIELYKVTNSPAFIAAVRHRLETFDISDFNAGDRAAMNASKQRALELSTSDVEHAVLQFKADWPGFFARRKSVAEYVAKVVGGTVHPGPLKGAMQRARFETVGKQFKINGQPERLAVIRGISPADLSNLNGEFVAAWCLHWEAWFALHGHASDDVKAANPCQMPRTAACMPVAAIWTPYVTANDMMRWFVELPR